MSKNDYKQIFNNDEFLEKYYIDDIGMTKNTRVFIVLESPHKDEILKHVPASGSTGIEISKALIDKKEEKAISELINDNDSRSNRIALINCFNIPMQLNCYSDEYENSFVTINRFIETFSLLAGFKQFSNNQLCDILCSKYKAINTMFILLKEKLELMIKNTNENIAIVLCGNVSIHVFNKVFFNELNNVKLELYDTKNIEVNNKKINIFCVNHPSPRNDYDKPWTKGYNFQKNKNHLKAIKELMSDKR